MQVARGHVSANSKSTSDVAKFPKLSGPNKQVSFNGAHRQSSQLLATDIGTTLWR